MAKKAKKELRKGESTKKRRWFSGLGSIGGTLYKVGQIGELEDAKGNLGESAKQGAIALATGVAGVIAGSAVGKASLLVGLATAIGGAFTNSVPLLTFGVGMAGGSNRKLTPEQKAQIEEKHKEQSWSKQLAISKASVNNQLAELKEKTYIDAFYKQKTETKPTSGLGFAGSRRSMLDTHELTGTAQTAGEHRYTYAGKADTEVDVHALSGGLGRVNIHEL
jgi:hypothetical protein